ncbi:MAG: polysaccharide deacetylase [Bdellovibrionaceae bacterium]|nr:polysaccharide deacetylase [Pseudobdellovibrionaceae bacterium]|tara:strand:+ start:2067 stop:2957 length:891 start_codon:yes stop_codon:yes gene_type:complete
MLILLGILLIGSTAFAAEFAITIDDPNHYESPLLSPAERDLRIRQQADHLNTKVALFVCGKRVDSKKGKALLAKWDDDGHLIGNHTYSHNNYNSSNVTFEEYSADVLRGESLIAGLKNFSKLFRFPFLKSGNTKEKRDRLRKLLNKNNYTHGYVTIDASDWYISSRMISQLKKNPKLDLAPYKKYYLHHILDRATYYDGLAKKFLGRSPKHTLLIHHNLLNALFLEDLINFMSSKGWTLIDARKAFKDPLYMIEPDTIPSGESIIWALAKEKKLADLRYPAEDGLYEKEAMDKLGL